MMDYAAPLIKLARNFGTRPRRRVVFPTNFTRATMARPIRLPADAARNFVDYVHLIEMENKVFRPPSVTRRFEAYTDSLRLIYLGTDLIPGFANILIRSCGFRLCIFCLMKKLRSMYSVKTVRVRRLILRGQRGRTFQNLPTA